MQLRYVFSELGQGLRRNVSMHLAVVLTLFVSLTLVGLGSLLQQQVTRTSDYFGNQLQLVVYLCNDRDATSSANCTGAVTDAQRQTILDVVEGSPEVASQRIESQEVAFEKIKVLAPEAFEGEDVLKASDMRESVWITLKDPTKSEGILSEVSGLDGVQSITDMRDMVGKVFDTLDTFKFGAWVVAAFLVLAALLMVANTIRLAAFARRKEIGIMRLVGASTLYIALPFLLEALVTAVLGVALAAGALWATVKFGFEGRFSETIAWIPWLGTSEMGWSIGLIALLGPALTLLPTLVLTRKYLKV